MEEITRFNVDSVCYSVLGRHTDYIKDVLKDMVFSCSGTLVYDYVELISDKLMCDIVQEIIENADHTEWFSDDVKLAFSRVLCKKLNINS